MKRKMIVGIIITVLFLIAGGIVYIHLPKFGSTPKGERLERMRKSPNYSNGCFQNINLTPQMTESARNSIFQSSSKHRKPKNKIPTVKTELTKLNPQENLLVWFGHSSCYFQVGGKRFLVDPVLSRAASPIPFINTAFTGTDLYKPSDIPDIDYLIITHDHWDHLDYPTVKELKPRIGKVICPLGVGEHFARWNFDESGIIEMDWEDTKLLDSGFEIYCLPARHFSGRGFRHGQSLWASFLLKTNTVTIFMSGDGGYDTHFASIGNRFGSIDFALLENGQYNKAWKYIHMMPEETLQAGRDLNAKNVIPIHNSKFALSRHSWDEPMQRITAANMEHPNPLRLLTPRIGEIVFLNDTTQTFSRWWQETE
ncbi:MAG: MBL fold metallo-hydrolase [Bacteroidales bacterium]|jgi:L-ascorbate metabolism protein UlaG (beta-lactamase superfamily)|nr:MBL fold metallo-hydrolase [Bacteroidales bacterium]